MNTRANTTVVEQVPVGQIGDGGSGCIEGWGGNGCSGDGGSNG